MKRIIYYRISGIKKNKKRDKCFDLKFRNDTNCLVDVRKRARDMRKCGKYFAVTLSTETILKD